MLCMRVDRSREREDRVAHGIWNEMPRLLNMYVKVIHDNQRFITAYRLLHGQVLLHGYVRGKVRYNPRCFIEYYWYRLYWVVTQSRFNVGLLL